MTMDNHAACYAAFQSKDSRFDGHFFVGVTSTRIYCRPVCRAARLPRPENCTFFKTAAEAERAGFRPRLLCRRNWPPAARRGRLPQAGSPGGEAFGGIAGALRAWRSWPRPWASRHGTCGGCSGRSTGFRRCSTCRPAACCWPKAC